MAPVIRSLFSAALVVAVTACADLTGLGGDAPPLVTFHVEVSGDPTAVVPGADVRALRLALIWGDQWLTEPLCILPPESAEVATAVAAGCRDPLGFVPNRIAATVDIDRGDPAAPTALPLYELPAADVMIGDVTARIAFGSLVIYDDRDGSGTLEFERPRRLGGRDQMGPPDDEQPPDGQDVVYGASFVSMTEPDQRVAFREGGFNLGAAFYPRRGCGEPRPGFSIVAAGGFSFADALAATLRGELPTEDPTTCREQAADTVVTIPVRPPAEVRQVACDERRTDSSIRYREPPIDMPNLTGRTLACAKLVDFGSGTADGTVQLVISGRENDACKGLTHYVLRGCREDAQCALPDWDITATPPTWWPCPMPAAR